MASVAPPPGQHSGSHDMWSEIGNWANVVVLAGGIFGVIGWFVGHAMKKHASVKQTRRETAEGVAQIKAIVPVVRQLEADVEWLRQMTEYQNDTLSRLMPNGRNTENPGDLVARIAEHLGIIPPKDSK